LLPPAVDDTEGDAREMIRLQTELAGRRLMRKAETDAEALRKVAEEDIAAASKVSADLDARYARLLGMLEVDMNRPQHATQLAQVALPQAQVSEPRQVARPPQAGGANPALQAALKGGGAASTTVSQPASSAPSPRARLPSIAKLDAAALSTARAAGDVGEPTGRALSAEVLAFLHANNLDRFAEGFEHLGANNLSDMHLVLIAELEALGLAAMHKRRFQAAIAVPDFPCLNFDTIDGSSIATLLAGVGLAHFAGALADVGADHIDDLVAFATDDFAAFDNELEVRGCDHLRRPVVFVFVFVF
jgi:hypothetical protein